MCTDMCALSKNCKLIGLMFSEVVSRLHAARLLVLPYLFPVCW